MRIWVIRDRDTPSVRAMAAWLVTAPASSSALQTNAFRRSRVVVDVFSAWALWRVVRLRFLAVGRGLRRKSADLDLLAALAETT